MSAGIIEGKNGNTVPKCVIENTNSFPCLFNHRLRMFEATDRTAATRGFQGINNRSDPSCNGTVREKRVDWWGGVLGVGIT